MRPFVLAGVLAVVYYGLKGRVQSPPGQALRGCVESPPTAFLDFRKEAKKELEKHKDVVARIETGVEKIKRLPRVPKRVLEAAGGTGMLLYGKHVAASTMFYQAFHATGWPIVKNAGKELAKSYASAREETERQKPQLLKMRKLLPKLLVQKKEAEATFKEMRRVAKEAATEFKAAESQVKRSKARAESLRARAEKGQHVDPRELKDAEKEVYASLNAAKRLEKVAAEGEEVRAKAAANMESIRNSYDEVVASTLALKAVADAVDPEHLAECARGVGTGLVSCAAAAKAPIARAACIGADLGSRVSEHVTPIVNSTLARSKQLPESFANWGACLTSSACTAGAAYAAFQLQEVAWTVAACALGAKTVTNAVSNQVQQSAGVALGDMKKGNVTLKGAMEAALTGVGVYTQVRPHGTGQSLPGALKLVLSPLLGLEAYFRAAAGAKR